MKEWENPEINELGVESTEFGPEPGTHVDAHFVDENGNSLWSYVS
ncbi:hypothetical protein [Clostridium sp. SM-530-WT-3G]|nr:hypothetical protein [Clostridium sp. SM-530-WT-3G]